MNLENWPFLVISLGIIFSADLVAFRQKQYSEQELLTISNQYSGIKWKYWGWAVVLVPLMFLTIYGGFALASSFPSIGKGLIFFFLCATVSYVSLYKSFFAFFTDVYPVNRLDGFVIGESDTVRVLALRGIGLVVLLLGLALAYALVPSIIANAYN